jgi:hypothetical protein
MVAFLRRRALPPTDVGLVVPREEQIYPKKVLNMEFFTFASSLFALN